MRFMRRRAPGPLEGGTPQRKPRSLMASIPKQPSGQYRARYRDAAGRNTHATLSARSTHARAGCGGQRRRERRLRRPSRVEGVGRRLVGRVDRRTAAAQAVDAGPIRGHPALPGTAHVGGCAAVCGHTRRRERLGDVACSPGPGTCDGATGAPCAVASAVAGRPRRAAVAHQADKVRLPRAATPEKRFLTMPRWPHWPMPHETTEL